MDQADLSAEVARNTRSINQQLERQLRLTIMINEAQDSSAEQLLSRLGTSGDLRRQLDGISRSSGAASTSLDHLGETGSRSGGAVNTSLAQTNSMLGQLQAAISNIDAGMMDLYGDMYEMQRAQQLAFGGALNQVDESENLVRTRLNTLYKDAYTAQYDYIEGANLSIVELYGSWENFYRDVASIFAEDYRMAAALADSTSTFTEENMRELGAYQRALGYNSRQTAAIMNRTISDHGNVNLELMENIAFYSKRADEVFGANMKSVSKDMATMIADVNRFGGLTEAQMAGFSVVANQLRLDIGQLANVAQGFEGFDQAASKVGNLTAVFGVQMNAMDLMMKSSTDMVGFVTDIRDSFMEAGYSADNLNIFQQRLIAQNLGLKVEEVRRLLSPDFDVSEWEEIEEAMSLDPADAVESALESVSGDMQRAQIDAEDLADVIGTNLLKAVGVDFAATFSDARGAISDFGGALTTIGAQGGTEVLSAMGEFFGGVFEGDPDKVKQLGESLAGFGTNMADAIESLTKGDLEAAGGKLVQAFSVAIPESAREGVAQGNFIPVWNEFVTRMRDAGIEVGALNNSPAPLWVSWGKGGVESYFDGMSDAVPDASARGWSNFSKALSETGQREGHVLASPATWWAKQGEGASQSYFYGMEKDLPAAAEGAWSQVSGSLEKVFGKSSVAQAEKINDLIGDETSSVADQLQFQLERSDGDIVAARQSLEARMESIQDVQSRTKAGQEAIKRADEAANTRAIEVAAAQAASDEEKSRLSAKRTVQLDAEHAETTQWIKTEGERLREQIEARDAQREADEAVTREALEKYGSRWTAVMEKFDEVQYDRTQQVQGDSEVFLETLSSSRSALSQITAELREQNISYGDLQGTALELKLVQDAGLESTTELAFAMDANARRQASRIESQADFAERELESLRGEGQKWENLSERQRERLLEGSSMSEQAWISSLRSEGADVGTGEIDRMREREMRAAVRESQRGTAEAPTAPTVDIDTEGIEDRLVEMVELLRTQATAARESTNTALGAQVTALRTAVQEVRDAVLQMPPSINGTVEFAGEKYGTFLIESRNIVTEPNRISGRGEGQPGGPPADTTPTPKEATEDKQT